MQNEQPCGLPVFAEREGFFLRCAAKALCDNEPRGFHPLSLKRKTSNPAGCPFVRRERDMKLL